MVARNTTAIKQAISLRVNLKTTACDEYIVFSDPAQLCPDDEPELTQRYVLATLYYSTDGDNWVSCY